MQPDGIPDPAPPTSLREAAETAHLPWQHGAFLVTVRQYPGHNRRLLRFSPESADREAQRAHAAGTLVAIDFVTVSPICRLYREVSG
jgi:hypothetical protein